MALLVLLLYEPLVNALKGVLRLYSHLLPLLPPGRAECLQITLLLLLLPCQTLLKGLPLTLNVLLETRSLCEQLLVCGADLLHLTGDTGQIDLAGFRGDRRRLIEDRRQLRQI